MDTNYIGLQNCLISTEQIPGIIGGLILSKNGDLICHSFEDDALLDKMTQLTLDNIKLMNILMREGRTGQCQSISIKGSFGMVDLFAVHSRKLVAATLGTEAMNVGLLRATLHEELSKIDTD